MNLEQALAGRAGISGLQWLLRGHEPGAVVRRQLEALVRAPDSIGECHIRRAKFRAGRRLNAYYDVYLQTSDGTLRPRPVAVAWNLDGGGQRAQRTGFLEAEAEARGLSSPFGRLEAHLPGWGMHVQVSPLDAGFPQLVRLLDPEYAQTFLAPLCTPAGQRYTVRSIRYRPGQRHVLCYEAPNGSSPNAVFAKFYPGAEGARAYEIAKRLADWLRASQRGIACVEPLAYLPEEGIVLYPQAPGVPLPERFRPPARDLSQELYRLGTAVRWLHSAPPHLSRELCERSFQETVNGIARSGKNVAALAPAAGASLNALLDRALDLYARLPQEPPGFAYGDLKADHIWVGPEGLTLIDTDSCCLADPAADVGKFFADLQYWCASGGLAGVERAQGWFVAGYAPAFPSMARARVYEAVLLAAIGMRRTPLFERDWARRIHSCFARAHQVLDRFPQWLAAVPPSPGLQGAVT